MESIRKDDDVVPVVDDSVAGHITVFELPSHILHNLILFAVAFTVIYVITSNFEGYLLLLLRVRLNVSS